jgi:hypothetical protein
MIVLFTGSTQIGRAISAPGAARLKRFGLELGGVGNLAQRRLVDVRAGEGVRGGLGRSHGTRGDLTGPDCTVGDPPVRLLTRVSLGTSVTSGSKGRGSG